MDCVRPKAVRVSLICLRRPRTVRPRRGLSSGGGYFVLAGGLSTESSDDARNGGGDHRLLALAVEVSAGLGRGSGACEPDGNEWPQPVHGELLGDGSGSSPSERLSRTPMTPPDRIACRFGRVHGHPLHVGHERPVIGVGAHHLLTTGAPACRRTFWRDTNGPSARPSADQAGVHLAFASTEPLVRRTPDRRARSLRVRENRAIWATVRKVRRQQSHQTTSAQ